MAAGVFGVPAGTLALVIGSLVSARPGDAETRFAERLRRPAAMR
jgi:Na+(H+)/acetate symporter ActP